MKRILTIILLLGAAVFPVVCPGREAASAELERLRQENRRLRQELDRLRQSALIQQRDLQQFKLWLAAVADDGVVMKASDREQHLIALLRELVRRSSRLAIRASAVSGDFGAFLREQPIGPARQARLLLQLEQLERSAMQVSALAGDVERSSGGDAFKNVRLLAVNRELDCAVFSAGSVHGVFPGLIYSAVNDPALRLRVISVRPWVSAAVPVADGIRRLTPGMRFTVVRGDKENTGIAPFKAGSLPGRGKK